jgi:hypothetical protein
LPIFSTGSGSVISSTTPFTFDNHTPESKPHLPTSTKTLRESPSQSFRKRAGSFDPPTTNQTNDEGLTILRIKRRRNEEPLDTLGKENPLACTSELDDLAISRPKINCWLYFLLDSSCPGAVGKVGRKEAKED